MVAVGAGSRYETKKINGISHFLEHMFFKGSKKYPSTEMITTLIDGLGAVNNAATDRELTYYWIKSAAKHIDIASDILSSMLKESLLPEEEIEREKGVINEEIRMYKDSPSRYVWDLYMKLQFGDTPLGWDIAGEEKIVNALTRKDFVSYMESLYSPKNMVLVYAGKIPNDIEKIAEKYFLDLPENSMQQFEPFKPIQQTEPRVDVYYKKTDQVNLILGMLAFDRQDPKRYPAKVLATILGEGMSSRLFIQVRERRGLAYHIGAETDSLKDTGLFVVAGGLKLEKVEEGLKVILAELDKAVKEKVTDDELKKAKEMIRGRLALRSESTNFLAEYFGLDFILDRKIETFEEYLKQIDKVTVEDVQAVAQELFKKERFNLQIIGPFKNANQFEKLLK
jgi:predicted Zn-dependent peptidase